MDFINKGTYRGLAGTAQSVQWLGHRGIEVRFTRGAKEFTLSHIVQPGLGPTQPPTQYAGGIKRQGREINYSFPSSADIIRMVEL
jgi:hypothetical protein